MARLGAAQVRDARLLPAPLGARPSAAWSDVTAPLRSQRLTLPVQLYKDWIEFMADTESAYKQDMSAYLKRTLGVQALVYGTQANYNQPFSRDGMDVSDIHSYFGDLGTNTGLTNSPGNGRPVFEVQNKSVLAVRRCSEGRLLRQLREQVARWKPNIITEYTYRDGNQYMAEAEPLMSAFAGFQDLDAIFLFNYHGMNYNADPAHLSGLVQHDSQRGHTRGCRAVVPPG